MVPIQTGRGDYRRIILPLPAHLARSQLILAVIAPLAGRRIIKVPISPQTVHSLPRLAAPSRATCPPARPETEPEVAVRAAHGATPERF